MVDDDDPKTAPAPDVPAGDKAEAPTEPPEGEQPEGEQPETEAPAQDELDLGDEADDEQDENEDEDDDEGDEGDEQPKRKESRAQRYKRRAEQLRAENEALRSRTSGGLPPDQVQLQRAFEQRVYEQIGDPPKEEDYQNNYVALERARQVYEFDKRQVMRETAKEFRQQIEHEQNRVADLVADHKERVNRFKSKVKDFDEVMARATLPVAPHVERLLLESKKSERLQYALGLNQSKLAQLNRMLPEAAAREIGRLEGRLSLPQPKTQTKARAPIKPLKGSGAASPSGLTAVNVMMKKMYPDRYR